MRRLLLPQLGRSVLLERLSHRSLQVHHGGGDGQRGVAVVPATVHVLDRVTGERVDEDTGGVGLGHALHLEDEGRRKGINTSCLRRLN